MPGWPGRRARAAALPLSTITVTAPRSATQNSTTPAATGDPIRDPSCAFNAARTGIPIPAASITAAWRTASDPIPVQPLHGSSSRAD